jgi:hypothetical protein
MRKTILGLVLGATMLAAPVAMASPASAEPQNDPWYCTNAWEKWYLPKAEFYACPLGTILVEDGYTGKNKYLIDGSCANRLWQDNRRATYRDAMARCTIKVF